MATPLGIGPCLRCFVERNASRAYRHGVAWRASFNSLQRHASLPPQRAQTTVTHFANAAVTMVRRGVLAKQRGFFGARRRPQKT